MPSQPFCPPPAPTPHIAHFPCLHKKEADSFSLGEHHRPAAKPIGERLSRHYYDVAQLYLGKIGQRAVVQIDLLESVVRHKSLFFHSGWANYRAAVPGSIHLLLKEGRLAELKRDYDSMAEMIFADPPTFDSILRVLGDLEQRINKH